MTDQADRAGSIARMHGFDASKPNVARIYDYLLGGKDNFAADRDAAQRLIEALPNVSTSISIASRPYPGRQGRTAPQGVTMVITMGRRAVSGRLGTFFRPPAGHRSTAYDRHDRGGHVYPHRGSGGGALERHLRNSWPVSPVTGQPVSASRTAGPSGQGRLAWPGRVRGVVKRREPGPPGRARGSARRA